MDDLAYCLPDRYPYHKYRNDTDKYVDPDKK